MTTDTPHLLPRDDARRQTEQPGSFEWWYVDAHLSDGGTLVAAFYANGLPDGTMRYTARLQVVDADGATHGGQFVTGPDDADISDERPAVRIGKSRFEGDLDTYHVVVDEAQLGGVGVDLTIRRTCPSRVTPANPQSIVDGEHTFGWVCPVPRGDLTGSVTYGGRTAQVTGDAYHDHNWGTTTMGATLHHWVWSRATIGPYTAVVSTVYPTQAYAHGHADGIQLCFVTSGEEVLLNVEGFDAAKMTADSAPNPDPRNPAAYYAPIVAFESTENGRQVRVQLTCGPLLDSRDLATQSQHLHGEELRRAEAMVHRPWYTRFAITSATLETTENGHTSTHSGKGIIEFMDFHLNP